VLQNMAIAYSKTGRPEDAIRAYRRALDVRPELAGAHYGLAFLLLKKGDVAGAERHLESFLNDPPQGADGTQWVEHARRTLAKLRNPEPEPALPPLDADASDDPRA
jgi:tetratricopeptide (TPR) repeat protein